MKSTLFCSLPPCNKSCKNLDNSNITRLGRIVSNVFLLKVSTFFSIGAFEMLAFLCIALSLFARMTFHLGVFQMNASRELNTSLLTDTKET